MTIPTRTLRQALLKKGFQQDKAHHNMYWLVTGGEKRAVRTRISHGMREIGNDLIARVAGQMKLSKRELLRFADCSISGPDYLDILVANGDLRR